MAGSVFEKLQERLDTYSMGFPKTKSGIEIKILKKLFSDEDAKIFLKLSPKLESAGDIAERIDVDSDMAEKLLSDMAKRGLLFSLNRKGVNLYGAIPFVHGLFEFQIKRMDSELAGLVRKYMDEEFKDALSGSLSDFLRVIPVQKSVDTRSNVASYEDAIKILEKADPIVISECACRKSSKLTGKGCDRLLEACFMFGSMGQYYIDHNMGRKIDITEASEILKKAHDEGLITQPATSQNPSGMCNCCGDCCGPLTSLKNHPKPAEMVFSNYYAQINEELCTGCETCVDRCQMTALVEGSDDTFKVDRNRCIGCGLCVTTCPVEAIELIKKESNDFKVPPANSFEQMMNMAKRRGVI